MKAKIILNGIKKNSEVEISGYKHSFVVTVCAALLCNLQVEIQNVPEIKEKEVFIEILNLIGKKYQSGVNCLTLFHSEINQVCIPSELSEKIHGSMYLIPVLLHLNKNINIFESGGCKIGSADQKSTRPLNHVLDVMKKFGAKQEQDCMILDEYHGAFINIMEYSTNETELRGPFVSGATKTAILCSLGSKEPTTIQHPYMKADVMELLQFIQKIGYKADFSENRLTIEKKRTCLKQVSYSLASDVTEIISFITFAVYYDVKLTLTNVTTEFVKEALKPEFEYLVKMGIHPLFEKNTITVLPYEKISAVDIEVTGESIYSDSQPFFALLLSKAKETSVITDFVWNNRMEYAKEMKKAGMNFQINENVLKIQPGSKIILPMELCAKDLRGAAVLVLFGAQAAGTVINGCEHIERGYENFWRKLKKLGIEVELNENE